MPRFRRLTATQVREKSSPLDLVTEADEVAEAVITTGLKVAFPGAIVIGEEGTHKDPALLQLIADAELAFIVDPIDGTENFTANLSLFGVMAAVRSAPRSISWLSTKMTERRSGPWADRKIDGRRG